MASFDNPARWEKYIPPIAHNRELERPFHLFILAGVTRARFEAFNAKTVEAWTPLTDKAKPSEEGVASALDLFCAALDGLVRFGDEPLNVNGEAIADVRALVGFLLQLSGYELLIDLVAQVRRLNTIVGAMELFYARQSGGSAGTAPAPKTAAR